MAPSPAIERKPLFAEPRVGVEALPGGGMILRSPYPLARYPRALGDLLVDWAARDGARVFLAERRADGSWRKVSYGAALRAARSIGQALLDRDLGPDRPVMILSDNGIDHALLSLGAMQVGVPVAPVSTAYSRLSQDFAQLRQVAAVLQPGLVFADDGARYEAAFRALPRGAERVVSAHQPPWVAATPFVALTDTRATGDVDDAFAALGPDTVAKILFTSGSTGEPKGVINTQRMLCANQESLRLVWPFLAERPPVILDWLPWNHTFGGNHNFNLVLRNGGTLYIDDGKPAPGLIERSAANLREVSPTLYFNVPRGYAMLLDHLEREEDLARAFFAELDLVFYAGAALPQSLWERIENLSARVTGRKIPLVSSWGTTETAPLATAVHYPIARAGNIGLPVPGVEVKLVPAGDRLELRVRGASITPGYWRRPDLTAAAFDEDGFYKPGDAALLADPADPVRGLIFDGRIGENFKLGSGTWVHVGALRLAAIAAGAPVIEDAVVAGHDRDEVGLLVFPSLAGCRSLCPHLPPDASLADLIAAKPVREALARGLARHNATAGGSSHRIARALLLATPPAIDHSEITDKGYINQRAVLTNRKAMVDLLYADPPGDDVVLLR